MQVPEADAAPSDDESLPAEVLEALDSSAVVAIKTLQKCRGIGLYEAKLAVDAYLRQHPEHPLAWRVESNRLVPDQPVHEDSFVELSPVVGEAVALDPIARRTSPARAYVIARAALTDGGRWTGAVLKACLGVLDGTSSIEVVDEVRSNEHGDIASLVAKVVEPVSSSSLEHLGTALGQGLPKGVEWHLIPGIGRGQVSVAPTEIEVEYFLQEFSYKSSMVGRTTNSVRLKHRPTGIECRSTAHRARVVNYEEALLLLSSLLEAAR